MRTDPELSIDRPSGADFLPDFCAGPPVLVVLVIAQMVAILLTLAVIEFGPGLWNGLFLLSLYVQWIGLCSAAGLCAIRRLLHDQPGRRVAVLAYVLLLTITAVISEIAYLISASAGLPLALEMSHDEFLIRSFGVCAVVSALTLRYFWVQRQWRRETIATGQARYELLQARIRPHFLFNALNSIAELTASSPRDAEVAVEDLATLFRANLDQADKEVSLAEELFLCRAYLRMEQLRLGERMKVDWQIDPASESARLPALSLQPLLENAVRHGVERLPEGGQITIKAGLSDSGQLQIDIRNPVGALQQPGRGEALENIQQRLHWRYGDAAKLDISTDGDLFHARLYLPGGDMA